MVNKGGLCHVTLAPHVGSSSSPHSYRSTSFRSLVLATSGQHPEPLPCTMAMQIPVSRKNVKIRDKIFRSTRTPAISVTLSQQIHEEGIAHYILDRKTARINMGSPRLIA